MCAVDIIRPTCLCRMVIWAILPAARVQMGLRLKQLAGFFLAFGTQQHIRQGHIKSGRKERSDMNDRAVSKV
jgi:hypothetical protein